MLALKQRNKNQKQQINKLLLLKKHQNLLLVNRYGVKSGVIFYDAPMGTKQELYFDDYGAKEVSITSIDLGIAKSKSIEIRKDGFSYTYEEGKTEGTKKAWYVPASTDYSKADPKTLERYKVKDLGN